MKALTRRGLFAGLIGLACAPLVKLLPKRKTTIPMLGDTCPVPTLYVSHWDTRQCGPGYTAVIDYYYTDASGKTRYEKADVSLFATV